jgi:4-hydroxy-3-methylbut-2-enyl diphosphate reductase
MRVLIDAQAGFCPGVRKAVAQVEDLLQQGKPVTALGSLIHNQREIDRLAGLGLNTVAQESASQPKVLARLQGSQLFVRTHGVGERVRGDLDAAGFSVIDGTCPTVQRVQRLIVRHHQRGEQIVIIGKKGHAEVLGFLGHCGNKGLVIETEADIAAIDPEKPTLILAQTTVGRDRFENLTALIRARVRSAESIDTTCRFIGRRHEQVRKFAAEVDVVIFVGGRESSNSRVLFEMCSQINSRSYKIESPAELDFTWFKREDLVGITGGASTPLWQFEEIRAILLRRADLNTQE